MVIRNVLKRIYSIWTEGFRSPVKQILACSLVLIGFSQIAFAQETCEDLFADVPQLGAPKTIARWEPRPGGPSMDQHNFNSLGKLGNLYDLVTDPVTGKVQALKNKHFFDQSRRQLKKRFNDAPEPASKAFVARVNAIVSARELPGDLVIIKINQDTLGFLDPFTEGHRAKGLIINRLFRTYETLVTFGYRLSGLEENSVSSSVHMHLEASLLRSRLHSIDYNLVFDKKVWASLLRLLENDVHVVETTSWNSNANKLATHTIIDVNEPLYPMAGVALMSDRKNPGSPIEIKRYFKNDYEDPLGLVGVSEKNEFRARHEMLYEIFNALPAGQPLEIHAHSIVHARAYMKLGFKRTEIMENPLYPGVQVHLLKATREEAMEKIAAVIRELK
jgi:hypothetical protein